MYDAGSRPRRSNRYSYDSSLECWLVCRKQNLQPCAAGVNAWFGPQVSAHQRSASADIVEPPHSPTPQGRQTGAVVFDHDQVAATLAIDRDGDHGCIGM